MPTRSQRGWEGWGIETGGGLIIYVYIYTPVGVQVYMSPTLPNAGRFLASACTVTLRQDVPIPLLGR
jgi:hypothetical protein